MRKIDKKIDNQLRESLTDACESALEKFTGFQWLTHVVSYPDFPKTLKIVCVFDTKDNLKAFLATSSRFEFSTLLLNKLIENSVNIKNIASHISYDTEEDCDKNHDGNWAARLAK